MNDNDHIYTTILDNVSDGIYFVDRQRTITFWNRSAERITGYKASELIGQECQADILMHINEQGVRLCTGLCPLAKTLYDGLAREELVYLFHKAGHRIPVTARFMPIRDDNKNIIGVVEIFRDISSKLAQAAKVKSLAKMAYVDPLTGLVNRQYIEYKLGQLLQDLAKGGQPFGILQFNIDQFRKFNDHYGSRFGDEILKILSETLASNVTQSDTVGRWVGAKYVIISQNANKGMLLLLANKLKTLVEQSGLKLDDLMLQVTVSISGAIASPGETVEGLLERVEKIMAYNLVRIY